MMAAMSIGSGRWVRPSQVYLLSSALMSVNVLISITSRSCAIVSGLILAICLEDTNMAFVSECRRMFSTSLADSSGSMGTAILP